MGVVVLGSVMLIYATTKDEASQYVLASVLPLLGTWVGPVLAFYFSKDNFEAATRSTQELLGIDQKLAAIPVSDVMIAVGEMLFIEEDDDGKIAIKYWLEKIDAEKKGKRLPVLSSKATARYIIHRSALSEFVAFKAIEGTPKADLEKLTLKDLVTEMPALRSLIQSFGAVRQDATLDKVKAILEQSNQIQDVFITKNGKIDGEVVGWVTNVILDEYSKV